MLVPGAVGGGEDHAHLVGRGVQFAGGPGVDARGSPDLRERDPVPLVQGVQPAGGHPLRLGAQAHQLAQQRLVLLHLVRLALGVHDVAGLRSPVLHVQQLTASQSVRALGLLLLAFGEDEGRLLDGPATLAGPLADRPALRGTGLLRVGQPVGGVGNAERRAVRDLAVVEHRLVDVDDLALVRVEEELGGGHVQDGVELCLAVGRQHHIASGGLAGNDDVLLGFVPFLGRHRFEHPPGAEHRENHHTDDRAGHHRTKRSGRALLRAGRARLYELRDQPSLREGVGVEFVPS